MSWNFEVTVLLQRKCVYAYFCKMGVLQWRCPTANFQSCKRLTSYEELHLTALVQCPPFDVMLLGDKAVVTSTIQYNYDSISLRHSVLFIHLSTTHGDCRNTLRSWQAKTFEFLRGKQRTRFLSLIPIRTHLLVRQIISFLKEQCTCRKRLTLDIMFCL